ncbi:TPA: serine protein kinase RIO [Candidatus Woesearchaeota archaeon]|nr:serine protein kinase RIO [Candidatus Woesearchaeota archaeon]
MSKITREKFKTYQNVFDNFTLRKLFELGSKGLFLDIKSPISIGKEANIFTAEREDGSLIILKIYRLETCDFNRMYDYIKYDVRYLNLKSKKREIIFNWAQREFRNLQKAREAGVRVPTPIHCSDHIVIMELIGEKEPASKLKDHYPEDPKKYFEKLRGYMRQMWKAGLVHGDLSEFNILNHKDSPVFIDFSQGTITRSGNAIDLLKRDCKNMARFWTKLGLKVNQDSLYDYITKEGKGFVKGKS